MTAHSLQLLPTFEIYSEQFLHRLIARDGGDYDPEYLASCLRYSKKLLDNGVPVIFDRDHLCHLTGFTHEFIQSAAGSPHLFYRSFAVPKKSGGSRLISEPLPSLKVLQAWIYENILLRVPVSVAAKAFIPGAKLRDAARFHLKRNFVVRIDIANFFPTISRRRVFGVFRSLGYSSSVAGDLSRLCCLDDCLPQGGVCSAYISNIVLRRADARLLAFARASSLRYTRYADDFTVSGDNFSPAIVEFVQRVIVSEGFEVNHKKTAIMRPGSRQLVVGHVVNARLNAPREYRRALRQAAYYIEKHGIDSHLAHLDERRSGARDYYLGKASFALTANPSDRDARRLRSVLLDDGDR